MSLFKRRAPKLRGTPTLAYVVARQSPKQSNIHRVYRVWTETLRKSGLGRRLQVV